VFNWPSNPIRVLVDHGDPLVAIGISTVLAGHSDILVLNEGQVAEGAEPSLVLVVDYDAGMRIAKARREGDLQRILPQPRRLEVRILLVTSKDTEDDVISALEMGVEGYIEQSCDVRHIVEAVRGLARGSRHLSPMAAGHIACSMTRSPLTDREREVLSLVACGRSNKAVASLLNISLGTVKAHMKAILSKLDARSRTEAATVGRERGLVRNVASAAQRA